MKKLHKPQQICLALALAFSQLLFAQAEKPELSVSLRYFNQNGALQYLKVKAMVKEENKLQPVAGAVLHLYLDEANAEHLIGKVTTDSKGEAKSIIPPSLKESWSLSPAHTFLAVSEKTKKFEEATAELSIAKARIVLDTLNEEGVRKVRAQVMKFDSSGWMPVPEVDVKLGVQRLGGELKIGDEETYTTDSTGTAVGEFKTTGLPAMDQKNNILLVAKIEDNEEFGNLSFDKPVPWGKYTVAASNFERRSLWGTRDKAPVWLLLMAGSIMAAVWGVIIYLVLQIRKLKKIGKRAATATAAAPREVELQDV